MATLIKQHGRYYLQFYSAQRTPARKRVPLYTRFKREALEYKRELETGYNSGTYSPWHSAEWRSAAVRTSPAPGQQSISSAVEAFLESRAGCRKTTRDHYRWVLGQFASLHPDSVPIDRVSDSQISRWLASKSLVTRRTYLTRLKVFFGWLKSNGLVTRDPTSSLVVGREPEKLTSKIIREEDIQTLLQSAMHSSTPYLAPIILVTLDLALRLGEVCALKESWIDFRRGVVIVHSDATFTTKVGKDVVKPMTDRCRAILESHISDERDHVFVNTRGNPIAPKHTSKQFKRLVRSVGLSEGITFHSLRHTSLSRMVAHGAPIETVRRFAGHSTVAMTMRHVQLHEGTYLRSAKSAAEACVASQQPRA